MGDELRVFRSPFIGRDRMKLVRVSFPRTRTQMRSARTVLAGLFSRSTRRWTRMRFFSQGPPTTRFLFPRCVLGWSKVDQVTVAGFIARDAQEELLDSRLPWCGPPFGERPWGVFNDSPRGQLILPPTNYRPSIHKGRGRVIGTGAILPSTSLPDQGRRPAREQLIPVQSIMAGLGPDFHSMGRNFVHRREHSWFSALGRKSRC